MCNLTPFFLQVFALKLKNKNIPNGIPFKIMIKLMFKFVVGGNQTNIR